MAARGAKGKAEAWNRAHSVGARVRYWPGARRGPGRESTTRCAAFVAVNGRAVVMVEGERSVVALDNVEASS